MAVGEEPQMNTDVWRSWQLILFCLLAVRDQIRKATHSPSIARYNSPQYESVSAIMFGTSLFMTQHFPNRFPIQNHRATLLVERRKPFFSFRFLKVATQPQLAQVVPSELRPPPSSQGMNAMAFFECDKKTLGLFTLSFIVIPQTNEQAVGREAFSPATG